MKGNNDGIVKIKTTIDNSELKKGLKESNDLLKSLDKGNIKDLNKEIKNTSKTTEDMGGSIKSSFKEIKDGSKEGKKNLKDVNKETSNNTKSFKELGKSTKDTFKTFISDSKNAIKGLFNLNKETSKSEKGIKEVNKETTKTSKSFKELGKSTKDTFKGFLSDSKKAIKDLFSFNKETKDTKDNLKKGMKLDVKSNVKETSKDLTGLKGTIASTVSTATKGSTTIQTALKGIQSVMKGFSGKSKLLILPLIAVTKYVKSVGKHINELRDKTIKAIDSIVAKTKELSIALTKDLFTKNVKLQVKAFEKSFDFLKGSLELNIDYEKAKSEVKAVGQLTDEQLQKMDKLAKEIGKTTEFSAKQSMDAIISLTRKGMNTDEIDKSLKHLVDGAIAFGEEIDDVADGSLEIVSQMGLSLNNLEDVLNQMSYATSNTSLGFDTLKEAMKEAGPAMNEMGNSLETTFTLIALLDKAGIKGSKGGTTIKALTADIKKAADTLGQINVDGKKIDLFTNDGQYRDVLLVMEDINEVTKDMTDKQRMKALDGLFGEQSAKAFTAFTNSSKKDLKVLQEGLKGVKKENDGLTKSFKKLSDGKLNRVINNQTVEFKKNNKELRNTKDIALDIVKATENMNKEARKQELSKMFEGNELEKMIELADGGSAKFEKLWESMSTSYLESQADDMSDNLAGKINSIMSAYESVKLNISDLLVFETGEILDDIADFLRLVSDTIEEDPSLETLPEVLVTGFVNGLSDFSFKFEDFLNDWDIVFGGFIKGLGDNDEQIADSINRIVSSMVDSLTVNTPLVNDAFFNILSSSLTKFNEEGTGYDFGKWAGTTITNLITGLIDNSHLVFSEVLNIVEGALDGINDEDNEIGNKVRAAVEKMKKEWDERWPDLKPKFEKALDNILDIKDAKVSGVNPFVNTVKKDVLDVVYSKSKDDFGIKMKGFWEDSKFNLSNKGTMLWEGAKTSVGYLVDKIQGKLNTLKIKPTVSGSGAYNAGYSYMRPTFRSLTLPEPNPNIQQVTPHTFSAPTIAPIDPIDSIDPIVPKPNLKRFNSPQTLAPYNARMSRAQQFSNSYTRSGNDDRKEMYKSSINRGFSSNNTLNDNLLEEVIILLQGINSNTETFKDKSRFASQITPFVSRELKFNDRR